MGLDDEDAVPHSIPLLSTLQRDGKEVVLLMGVGIEAHVETALGLSMAEAADENPFLVSFVCDCVAADHFGGVKGVEAMVNDYAAPQPCLIADGVLGKGHVCPQTRD